MHMQVYTHARILLLVGFRKTAASSSRVREVVELSKYHKANTTQVNASFLSRVLESFLILHYVDYRGPSILISLCL